MPYITEDARDSLAVTNCPGTAGELNYMFTMFALDYLDRKHETYQTINDIIGALECCKQEFYRRIAAPYEELKIRSNGDVYKAETTVLG